VSISQPVSNSYTLAIQGETLIRNHSLGTSKQAKELYTRKDFRPSNSPAFRRCHPDFVKITRSPG